MDDFSELLFYFDVDHGNYFPFANISVWWHDLEQFHVVACLKKRIFLVSDSVDCLEVRIPLNVGAQCRLLKM